MGDEALLSAVLIARNEEPYIGACIEAVRRATAFAPNCEIVLVDSRSTDRTVEIATAHGIRVIQLSGRPPCCPALGRHVGIRLTRSRYVVLADGDSEFDAGFVQQAVAAMERDDGVVAVGGQEEQVYYRNGRIVGTRDDYFGVGEARREVLQLGGNGVYRRAALEAGGSSHPFIRSWEEAELGARLRHAGGRIVRLPIPMARHHTPIPDSPNEYLRRVRNHLLTGQGQVLRATFGQKLFRDHAWMLSRLLLFIVWMAMGAVALAVSLVARTGLAAETWAVGGASLLVAFMLRGRSVRKPFRLVFDWLVCAPPLLWGVLIGAPHPSSLRLEEAVARDSIDKLRPVPSLDRSSRLRRAGGDV